MTDEQRDASSANSRKYELYLLLSSLETLEQPEDRPKRIAVLQRLLELLPRAEDPELWVILKVWLGDALQQNPLGDQSIQLMDAVFCYDDALQVYRRQQYPDDWARVQHNKGNALRVLAKLLDAEQCVKALRASLICFENALLEWQRAVKPLNWAIVQNSKGAALRALADMCGGEEHAAKLREAIACYDHALEVQSLEKTPSDWARSLGNKSNALHRLAESQGGEEGAKTLREALECCEKALLASPRERVPRAWAEIQHHKATILHELASLLGGVEQVQTLRDAVACLDNALQEWRREVTPDNWAMAQNTKGIVLGDLAGVMGILSGAERVKTLREAIVCHENALLEWRRDASQLNWAAAQTNVGGACNDLARLLAGDERIRMLQKAVACYDDVLLVYRREDFPDKWALVQQNKGKALHDLARSLGGSRQLEALQASTDCFEEALKEYRREVAPLDWAMTQNNKGNTFYGLAGLLAGKECAKTLEDAIACYDNALLEYRREVVPSSWAMLQANKGNALYQMARLHTGTQEAALLQDAITCYGQALQEFRHEVVPAHWATLQQAKGAALAHLATLLQPPESIETLQVAIECYEYALQERPRAATPAEWATTQNNKGSALRSLAKMLSGPARIQALRDAIACHEGVLQVRTRETAPPDWAMTQNSKGVAVSDLASLLQGTERIVQLSAAIACYDEALLEQRREVTPTEWAMTQNNKAIALRDLARELVGNEHKETVGKAIECYDNALSVHTRDAMPSAHRDMAQSAGMMLFAQGEWVQAVQYLSMALDALDDLFALEVTTHGRRTTLKTGGDLTAHLAYALVRIGGSEAFIRAAEVLDRGRARITGEVIARQEAQITEAERLAPGLLQKFREVSDRLLMLTADIQRTPIDTVGVVLEQATRSTPVVVAGEETAIKALNRQLAGYREAKTSWAAYHDLVAHIRERLPDFMRRSDGLSIATKMLAPDERFVYIASSAAGTSALLMGNASVHLHASPVAWWDEQLTRSDVAALLTGTPAQDSEQHITGGLLSAQYTTGGLNKALQHVMQTLGTRGGVLTQLAAYCRSAQVRRLILVPCGLLSLLPLHAALVPTYSTKEGVEPLLDVVQIGYAPSAGIWAACRRRVTSHPLEELHTLIVSDPQPLGDRLPQLKGAIAEAIAVKQLIEEVGGTVSPIEGTRAKHPVVLEALQAGQADLTHIHFACHGIAVLNNPYDSGLILARGRRLTIHDLLKPATGHFEHLRLASLAACRTGLPGTDLPDEVVGLPAGWLQAGAGAVLASLWPVSDAMTVALMTKFYELHIHDRLEPVEALWLAQRWLRALPAQQQTTDAALAARDSEAAHEAEQKQRQEGPLEARHWASFVIYGA